MLGIVKDPQKGNFRSQLFHGMENGACLMAHMNETGEQLYVWTVAFIKISATTSVHIHILKFGTHALS